MQYVCINFLGFFSGGWCKVFHTPRADCNKEIDEMNILTRNFASTRPVQIATAEMHRIAICTFQNVC